MKRIRLAGEVSAASGGITHAERCPTKRRNINIYDRQLAAT